MTDGDLARWGQGLGPGVSNLNISLADDQVGAVPKTLSGALQVASASCYSEVSIPVEVLPLWRLVLASVPR